MVFNNITEYPVVQYVFDGIRPAVVALILYAVIKLAKSAKITEYFNWLIALAAVIAIAVFGLHPIIVIVAAALYGLFIRGAAVKAVDAHRAGADNVRQSGKDGE